MTGKTQQPSFPTLRVSRTTGETRFEILVSPRRRRMAHLPLTNQLLSHFVDHLCKAAGIDVELVRTDWPASWELDHVLCEDVGQLIGRAVAEIHRRRVAEVGVPGRASATCCMDDCRAGLTLSLEGRALSDWRVEGGSSTIDGFVDSWFADDGRQAGWASGTNLRQFFDGFAHGAGATVHVTVDKVGNLHHFYEALFRALGDAIRSALELPGGDFPVIRVGWPENAVTTWSSRRMVVNAALNKLILDAVRSPDPLSLFGIDRGDDEFDSVVTDFQRVFEGELDLGWTFAREVLSESQEAISAAFETLIELGYELRVCTGRHRKEIEMPIRRLGLDPYLVPERLTCADEVDRAEGLTGYGSLGKPHWFAPMCSVLGFDEAVGVLGGATIPAVAGRRVYVGDAAADYQAVRAANELGLEMRYVHVRSGASWEELEESISGSPLCLGVVDRLSEMPPLLEGVQG